MHSVRERRPAPPSGTTAAVHRAGRRRRSSHRRGRPRRRGRSRLTGMLVAVGLLGPVAYFLGAQHLPGGGPSDAS
ncbi:MAG TPA: hypothetical protein DD420_02635, partial [Streptomyces sp.]|nr:hypothetical protein [Streptomyces sp.]